MSQAAQRLPLTSTALSLLEEYKGSPRVVDQFKISPEELKNVTYSLSDPIGDELHTVTKGLVHRYKDRVLFKVTDQCVAYCQFCFRKDMLNQGESVLQPDEIYDAITYIKNHTEIKEVILSGGDPFVLSIRRLSDILNQISVIPHITKIRFHTRVPIIKPSRINDGLLHLLNTLKQEIRVVLHVNHADELNPERIKSINIMHDSGLTLMSQSVLLKNINNSKTELNRLFTALHDISVRPYYLHHLDKAHGTHHFRVSIKEGQKLMQQLKALCPEYTVPDYVIDIPGGFGKRALISKNLRQINHARYMIKDMYNNEHLYIDEAA